MFHFAAHKLIGLLTAHGYWAVFFFMTVESSGIPFPGETMLLIASVYAGTTHRLSLLLVIIAAAAGAIVGDNLGFWAGREGGYRLVRRYGRFLHLDERKLKVGQYLFLKHGGKVVFFGRFIAVLRTWAAFLAGVNRMPWGAFLRFNALGGIVWAAIVGSAGYLFGKQVVRLEGALAPVAIVLGVATTIAGVIFVRRNERRLEEAAERALPGPLDAHSSGHHGPNAR
jgi:membrane protein DedA with SNARE-associated domain